MPITIDFIAWMATRDTREKHFRCDTGRKSRRWNLFVPREIYAEGPSLRVFLHVSTGRPASGRQFPHPSAGLRDTRLKRKFVRGLRRNRARRNRNDRRRRLGAEQLLLAQVHDVAHRRCAEQPAVFAAELRRAFVADCRGHRTDVAALSQQ